MGERGHPGPPGPPGEQGLPGLTGKEGTKVGTSSLWNSPSLQAGCLPGSQRWGGMIQIRNYDDASQGLITA